jgi:hypothetical protein
MPIILYCSSYERITEGVAIALPAPPVYVLSTPKQQTAILPFGPVLLLATLVLSYCTALVVMAVYPVGVAPLLPDEAGLLPLAACAYDATATAFQKSANPVVGLLPIFIVRLLIVVVPTTVTARTRFLIQL